MRLPPNTEYPFELDAGVAGIAADLTFRIEDDDDNVTLAESGGDITEFSVGNYRRKAIVGDTKGFFTAIWKRVSTGTEATEQFEVAYTEAGTASVDVDTPLGQVRLLITDIGGQDGDSFVFNDAQITAFYNLRGQSINRGAALALRTMAGNELLIDKRINFLGLSTDGEAVADGLRKLAGELEGQADVNEGDIEVIEMDTTVAADRQMRWSGT